jgi:hypothetical protein
VPGPPESVPGSLGVGEERFAARPGEQPDPAGPDGLRGRLEADRDGRGEHPAGRPGLAGPGAGGAVGGPGLGAVLRLGEGERERAVGPRVAVVIDVDPVDRGGVELPAGDDRGGQLDRGPDRRVRIDDQHRLAGASDDLTADDLTAYTSVRSSRVPSPGNLRLSALKWSDMVTPLAARREQDRLALAADPQLPDPIGPCRPCPIERPPPAAAPGTPGCPELAGTCPAAWLVIIPGPARRPSSYPSPRRLTRSPRRWCAAPAAASPHRPLRLPDRGPSAPGGLVGPDRAPRRTPLSGAPAPRCSAWPTAATGPQPDHPDPRPAARSAQGNKIRVLRSLPAHRSALQTACNLCVWPNTVKTHRPAGYPAASGQPWVRRRQHQPGS